MARVLVTGATGGLGPSLVEQLVAKGHSVRVMVRSPRPSTSLGMNGESVRGDLLTGVGLAEAVAGVDTVLHAASDHTNPEQVDIAGTARMLAAAREAKVGHFIYVSIVGIERLPARYYRAKLLAEQAVSASAVPWSILRATQFHSLIDALLLPFSWLPIKFLPTRLMFQPIDSALVAERCAALAGEPPGGRRPDLGGPQVLSLGELATAWLAARKQRRPIVRVPYPGKVGAAISAGGRRRWPRRCRVAPTSSPRTARLRSASFPERGRHDEDERAEPRPTRLTV